VPKPSPSPSKLTNPANNLVSPPPSTAQQIPSPLVKQSSLSNDRNYNKGGPRSNSQGNGQGGYGPSGYYGAPRQQNPPMGGMGGHYPPAPMHVYPPQGGYPPYYNTSPPGMYPPGPPQQRYPPPGPYGSMGQPYGGGMGGGMHGQGNMYQVPQRSAQLNMHE